MCAEAEEPVCCCWAGDAASDDEGFERCHDDGNWKGYHWMNERKENDDDDYKSC